MTPLRPLSRLVGRRSFVAAAVLAGTGLAVRPAWALTATPAQSTGPFYPLTKPLDADNDLVTVAGRPQSAAGTVTHVIGRVLDREGRPLSGTTVEIWQCDAFGRYHHPRDGGGRDPNFQGFGRMSVGDDGAYRFRTIRPVPYGSRTPHIHFALVRDGKPSLTTQMYVEGEPRNERDFLLTRIRDPQARAAVIVPLEPAPDAVEPGALLATFDIVLPGT